MVLLVRAKGAGFTRFVQEHFDVDPTRAGDEAWTISANTFARLYRTWARREGLPILGRSGIAQHLRSRHGVIAVQVDYKWYLTGLLERHREPVSPTPDTPAPPRDHLARTRSQALRFAMSRPFPPGTDVTADQIHAAYVAWADADGIAPHHVLGRRELLARLKGLGITPGKWNLGTTPTTPAPITPAPGIVGGDSDSGMWEAFLRRLGLG